MKIAPHLMVCAESAGVIVICVSPGYVFHRTFITRDMFSEHIIGVGLGLRC